MPQPLLIVTLTSNGQLFGATTGDCQADLVTQQGDQLVYQRVHSWTATPKHADLVENLHIAVRNAQAHSPEEPLIVFPQREEEATRGPMSLSEALKP